MVNHYHMKTTYLDFCCEDIKREVTRKVIYDVYRKVMTELLKKTSVYCPFDVGWYSDGKMKIQSYHIGGLRFYTWIINPYNSYYGNTIRIHHNVKDAQRAIS
jgi:hypothetical protein